MPIEVMIAYIPLTFAIIILIYSSAFETSMPYKEQVHIKHGWNYVRKYYQC